MEADPLIPDIPISNDRSSNRRFLSSVRSVLLPPSSPSDATLCHSIHALSLQLKRCGEHDPFFLYQTLNLLTRISLFHPNHSPLVFSTIHSYLQQQSTATSRSDRLMLDAVTALLTVSDHCRSGSSQSGTDGGLLLSLLSSPAAAVRSRLLNLLAQSLNAYSNANYMRAFSVFLKDPYPLVRRAALDGLVGFIKLNVVERCSSMTERIYDRAAELLLDENEVVRLGAIRLVSELGKFFADRNGEVDSKEQLDEIFIQLCSMTRDMSMEVRLEAFIALGKTRLVSEDVLLQSLSKKILENGNGKKSLGNSDRKGSLISASSAAGAFVHGLEDEFYEVRRAACDSLGLLTIFSIQFADDALTLLLDILNDDTSVVRLQTFKSLLQIATFNRLKVQEKHMHMFLNALMDADSLIRNAARKVLRVMKLPDLKIFKSAVNGLLTNLEAYPEDEGDIICVLFCIAKSHQSFAVSFTEGSAGEMMEPSSKGELGLDRPRVAALLTLVIAATFSNEHFVCSVPTRLFSYAVPLWGRIYSSLEDIINKDSLLAFLFHCSRPGHLPGAVPNFKENEHFLKGVDGGNINNISDKKADQLRSSLQQIGDTSDFHFQSNLSDLKQVSALLKDFPHKSTVLHEATHIVKITLATVADAWPLIKSGCIKEVLRILRGCKEELAVIAVQSHKSIDMLSFASQYVKTIKLLVKIWEHLQPRKVWACGMGVVDLLLEKLDNRLVGMRYGFLGLSKEEELHVLKLMLLSCTLWSSNVGICHGITLKKLCATVSHIKVLCEHEPIEHSDFVNELIKCLEGKINEVSLPLPARKLIEIFSLEQFEFSGRFKHITAELRVPDNDSENPVQYIPGLPVGITFQIILNNVSSKDRLWLRMSLGDSVQYNFLDLCQFEGTEEARKCTVEVPFYRTQKAASFTMQACLGMECPFEEAIHMIKGQGGPKHQLMMLCKEKDIYLVIINKNS